MKLARVIGTVVASIKDSSISNAKLLMVDLLNEKLEKCGSSICAVDTVGAGMHEVVYITLSRESAYALPDHFSPVDAAITGIVDRVDNIDRGIYKKIEVFNMGRTK